MFLVGMYFWSVIWIGILVSPPGVQSILATYRLHFVHGVVSCIIAFLCLMGYVPEVWTTTCTLSYFMIDFFKNLLNHLYFNAPSYQSPNARIIEYFHHIFCFTVGIMTEFYYKDFCTFQSSPFVGLMFAELSTPMLMVWRYTKEDWPYLYIFGFLFFCTRIGYHGLYFIPECMRKCHYSVGYGFGIPYNAMNFYFMYTFIVKILALGKTKRKDVLKTQDKKNQ